MHVYVRAHVCALLLACAYTHGRTSLGAQEPVLRDPESQTQCPTPSLLPGSLGSRLHNWGSCIIYDH